MISAHISYLSKFYLFVAILWSCQTLNATTHNIVVITDPHVMAGELLVNDGKAFQDYIDSSIKLVDYSPSLFEQIVKEIMVMTPKPDLVLILGDLSKDAELLSHIFVKQKLDELKMAGIPTLVIPGNHDWGERSKAVYYDGDNTSKAATCVRFGTDDNSLEYIYANYGFRTYLKDGVDTSVDVERESVSSSLTYACEPISGLVLIGIDTSYAGVISETALDWVCSKASNAKNAGKMVIAMTHYPLIPHISGEGHLVYPSRKGDADRTGYITVRNRLADSGISLVFTGHTHNTDIAKDWNANLTKTIFDVTTGALCTYPCPYRILTFNEDFTSMSISTHFITTAGNSLTGLPFSTDVAKARYTSNGIVMSYINDLVAAGLNEDVATTAALNLAKAYIYHAEGNENINTDAQELLYHLSTLLYDSPTYLDIVNSMLLDISNWGDSERENQTDDLSYKFRTTSVEQLHKDKEHNSACYDLDGRRLESGLMRKGVKIVDGGKKIIK